ncbi:MAG: GNAT family N-acetyltransferase [Acidimicrobiales bacterium]
MRASIVSGPADLDHPPLAALLDRLRADGHPGLSERKRLDAAEPARGSFGVLCDDEDGHLVAYARCVPSRHPSPQWTMELLVHPHWRERVEPEVLAVLYVRLLTHGGGPLTWWTADPGQERLARASGWRIERTLARWWHRCPGTGGTAARRGRHQPLRRRRRRPGRARPAQQRRLRRTPRAGRVDAEDLTRRTRTDWYDPSHITMARRDASACGFCWLKRHAATRLVEVYAIGVDPEQHTPGLGRALLTHALHHFRVPDGGRALAMLYVDEANGPAVALYRRLGFSTAARQVAYRVSIPDGRAGRAAGQPPHLPGRRRRTSGPGR